MRYPGKSGGTARLFSAGSVPGKPCTGRGGGPFRRTGLPPVRERRRGKRLCAVPRICRSALVVAGQGRRTVSFPHPAVPAGDALSGGFFSGGNGGRRMSATLRPAGCAGESFPSCGQGKGGRAMPKRAPLGKSEERCRNEGKRIPGEGEDSANGRRREGRAHCGIPERAEGQRGSLVQAAFRGRDP